jgi:hypothetical protein
VPSTKYPTDSGFSSFGFRTKVKTFPLWKGVNREGDPSQIPGNQLRMARNIRPDSEGYACRGGQTKAADNAATSDMDGIFEANDIGAPELAAVDDPNAGTPYSPLWLMGSTGETDNLTILHVDTESLTISESSSGEHLIGPSSTPAATDFDDTQYGLFTAAELTGWVGEIPRGGSSTVLFDLPVTGNGCQAASIMALGSDLYVSWNHHTAASTVIIHTISRWDGVTLTPELEVTDSEASWYFMLGKQGITAYAAVYETVSGTGINLIYARTVPGSWTSLPIPGVNRCQPQQLCEFGGELWFAVMDDTNDDTLQDALLLYSTDGVTVTQERTVALSPQPAIACIGTDGFDLYYWYHDSGDGSSYNVVGRYHAGVFNDTYKDLQPDTAGYTSAAIGGFMVSPFGADLVVLNTNETENIEIWESPLHDIAGTWTKVFSVEEEGITNTPTATRMER